MRVAWTAATLWLGLAISHGARAQDAGRPDAGAPDAGRVDAGRADAGRPDAGRSDAGLSDASVTDAATRDGSLGDAGPDEPPAPPLRAFARDPSAQVARGRDVAVTAGDVAAVINARPAALRGTFAAASELDRVGEELVRERLLAAEARRRRLDRDPRIRRELDRILARAVLDPLVDASLREPVAAADVQRYYDSHPADFTRPERVRTSVIVLEDEPTARRVLAMVRRSRPGAFRGIVRRFSTDRRSRRRSGDAGFWDRVGGGTDPALVDAAFALAAPGQLVDHVVATQDELFYIIRLDERRPAEVIPLADLRVTIESRIRRERLGVLEDHVASSLAHQAGVQATPASRVVRMVPERASATAGRDAGVSRDAGR